ncbi:MAG: hypothetical protein IPN70_02825 [Candidatus Moraniibacteriota bacterium]|nr:MAG: hypothetical protein IPN70_02825 [Candidatus Moranbacteria bacterium]
MKVSHKLFIFLVLFLSAISIAHASFAPPVCDGTLVFKESSITCQKDQWIFATPPEIDSRCALSALVPHETTGDLVSICPAKGLSIFRLHYLVKPNYEKENQTGFFTLTLENQGLAPAPVELISIFLMFMFSLALRYFGYDFSFLELETARDRVFEIIIKIPFVFMIWFISSYAHSATSRWNHARDFNNSTFSHRPQYVETLGNSC